MGSASHCGVAASMGGMARVCRERAVVHVIVASRASTAPRQSKVEQPTESAQLPADDLDLLHEPDRPWNHASYNADVKILLDQSQWQLGEQVNMFTLHEPLEIIIATPSQVLAGFDELLQYFEYLPRSHRSVIHGNM